MDELMTFNLFATSLPAAVVAMSLFGGLVVVPALRCGVGQLGPRPDPEPVSKRH